jgi:hypothetical protein
MSDLGWLAFATIAATSARLTRRATGPVQALAVNLGAMLAAAVTIGIFG